MRDYRKPKQAMEARREKRRGRGRPRRTWEDCVIDVARRKGKTGRYEETGSRWNCFQAMDRGPDLARQKG
jgi:hypothetical protein